MPKLRYGGIVTDSRGSQGGITYTSSQAGPTARTRRVPTTRQNPRTTLQHARIQELARRWATVLTDFARGQWRTLAFNNPVPDQWGNPQRMSGANMYTRVNMNRLLAGLPTIDTAPPTNSPPPSAPPPSPPAPPPSCR